METMGCRRKKTIITKNIGASQQTGGFHSPAMRLGLTSHKTTPFEIASQHFLSATGVTEAGVIAFSQNKRPASKGLQARAQE